MRGSNAISFETATASLTEENRALALEFDARALKAGYERFTKAAGKKPNNYKIEYKRSKSSGSLFVSRIDGKKLSVRCKLFHLNDYAGMLDELSAPARQMLLSSKKCTGNYPNCKGPVKFAAEGKECSLCRHSIQFRSLSDADISVVWKLLEAESRYEAKTE